MPTELARHDRYDASVFTPFDPLNPALICTVCGQPLTGDPEDQPAWPGGPLDGECYRAREFDNELDWSDDADDASG